MLVVGVSGGTRFGRVPEIRDEVQQRCGGRRRVWSGTSGAPAAARKPEARSLCLTLVSVVGCPVAEGNPRVRVGASVGW